MLEGYLIKKCYPKQSENSGEGIEELIMYTQVCKHKAGKIEDNYDFFCNEFDKKKCYTLVINIICCTFGFLLN